MLLKFLLYLHKTLLRWYLISQDAKVFDVCLFPDRLLATLMLFVEMLDIFLVLHQFIQCSAAQLLTKPKLNGPQTTIISLLWLSVHHRIDFSLRQFSSVAFCWAVCMRCEWCHLAVSGLWTVGSPLEWQENLRLHRHSDTHVTSAENCLFIARVILVFMACAMDWLALIVDCGCGPDLSSLCGNSSQIFCWFGGRGWCLLFFVLTSHCNSFSCQNFKTDK